MTMQDKLLDIRFAFERDLIRHGVRLGNAGIIVLCVECEEDFDRKSGTHVVCDDCKQDRVRRQTRDRVRRFRERTPYKTQNQAKVAQEETTTPDPYTNLMLALVRNAADEMDGEWLETNEEVYTQAILGRSLDGEAQT